jgi:hypothetical protein
MPVEMEGIKKRKQKVNANLDKKGHGNERE